MYYVTVLNNVTIFNIEVYVGQFTITLSDILENEVRVAVSRGDYGSVSDFIRDAIRLELSQKPRYWERASIVLALENNMMLKKLVDESELEKNELLEALRRGYSSDYSDAEQIARRDELSIEGSQFVIDVLNMYSSLQYAADIRNLSDKLKKDVMFEGFDGNAGDGYLGYTNFLVDNGSFTNVKPLDKYPHLNSHSMVNEVYQRMLSAYKPIFRSKINGSPKDLVLTADEVQKILDERIHPENR